MSFSMDVKEELQKHISSSRHCQIAEMASYVIHLAQLLPEKNVLVFHSENEGLIRKVFTLLKKIQLMKFVSCRHAKKMVC